MKLALQQLSVRKAGLVFGDERREYGPTQGVFDDFLFLRGAEQYADRRLLVQFLHIAVKRFEIEFKLAEMIRLKLIDFVKVRLERGGCLPGGCLGLLSRPSGAVPVVAGKT